MRLSLYEIDALFERSKNAKAKVSELEAQLRQERETTKDLAQRLGACFGQVQTLEMQTGRMEEYTAAVTIAKENEQLRTQIAQLKEDRDTWMGQAKRANLQVALLQTTVGQIRDVIRRRGQHAEPCFEDDRNCVCGISAALGRDSACPAPAKEE